MPVKQNSNATSLYIAEETIGTPKILPGTPVWFEQEPNSYSDFGGEFNAIARDPINAGRQKKRGTITDLQVAGGFSSDITQDNLTRLMQGFLFADAYEKFETAPINGSQITIASATTTTYTAASGLTGFRVGDLAFASGFTNAANNGLKYLSAVASGSVTTTGNVAEASPPAAASLEACGFRFASGDAVMTVAAGVATLSTTAKDCTQLGLQPGEWVFIGGDATANKFATCPVGYARVSSVAAGAIVFDKVTATFVSDTGTGKTLDIYFGKFIRNQNAAANIKTRTYNLERQLGSDGVGIQSEYIEGAIPNELKINIPSADKLTADLSFLAMDATYRTGTTGVKSGTRVASAGAAPFNTSRNLYRAYIGVLAAGTLQPAALFGYITQAEININNNASIDKAVGVLGGIDTTLGMFSVTGSLTAYFVDTAALTAVKNNSDVTADFIFAKDNAGIVYDIPLMGLGKSRLTLEKDRPITLPIDMMAAQGAKNYTLGYSVLPYLPTAAMPA